MRDEQLLRETLPGQWRVLATTFPMWLSGRRLRPTFSYEEMAGAAFTLRDVVSYHTRSGATRRITGVDRLDASTGVFTWRSRYVPVGLASKWHVVSVNDDRDLLVLTFERTLLTPAGMDVIGRGAGERPDARGRVSLSPDASAADREQFAALSWLG